MSLLQKTLLYLLLVAAPVAIGGGWLFNALIHRGIRYEIDEQLRSDLAFVTRQLRLVGQTGGREQYLLGSPHVEVTLTDRQMTPIFSDTVAYDLREKEYVPIRQLTATTRENNQTYRIIVKQAMGEFDEIAQLLSVSIIVAFMLLMGILISLNAWVARRLWQPFYQLIDQLRHYRLDAKTPTTFASSNIDEFNQLRVALNTMSLNLHKQYLGQKEFTEHAAHEIQTPLAIVTTQLDQLLATEPLTDEQVRYMEQAQGSIRRLVQLNRSLLLLTKIGNNQFVDFQDVNLSELIEKRCLSLEPYAHHRRIVWTRHIRPAIHRQMNLHLADVMFTNLIKNALAHAQSGTETTLVLTSAYFRTVNAGPPLPFPVDQLFGRFVKNPARSESTGLGLALVWQIADHHELKVTYRYVENAQVHEFSVFFQDSESLQNRQIPSP